MRILSGVVMPYNTHLWEKHNNGLTAVFSTPDALIECQVKTLLIRKVLNMTNISKNTPVNKKKTSPKYELTNETRVVNGVTLHRIKALRDFDDVKAGDLGGFIKDESDLSHDGNCWVYDDAMVIQASVSENAKIRNNACVVNYARVYGNAVISDKAWVLSDKAHVYDNAIINGNAKIGGYVFGNAVVSDNAVITEGALIYDNARVYENAQVSGLVFNDAHVYGKSRLATWSKAYGNAHVFDKAIVYGGSNIYDNAKVSGSARVGPCANIHDNAHVSGKAQICQFTTIYGNAVLKENKKFSEDVCGFDQDINNAA